MGPSLVVGAACALTVASAELARVDGAWVEQLAVEVMAKGPCEGVRLALPPGVTLDEVSGKLLLSDGSKRPIKGDRVVRMARGLADAGSAEIRLPELRAGDRFKLTVTRTWRGEAPFRWRPGLDGAEYAELRVPSEALMTIVGAPESDGRGWLFATDPAPDLEVRLHAGPTSARDVAASVGAPAESVDAALAAVDRLVVLPRAVDGAAPIAGDAALARGYADDRGAARTLVALLQGAAERVAWGRVLPPGDGPEPPDVDLGEVAVIWTDAGAVAYGAGREAGEALRVWTADGVVDASGAAIGQPPGGAPAPTSRRWTLQLPPGDPQVVLIPGHGSSLRVEERTDVDGPAQWFAPLPAGAAEVVAAVAPASAGEGRVRADGVTWLVQQPAAVTLSYVVPDAPTDGDARPGPGLPAWPLEVSVDGGVIVWDGPTWWLAEVDGVPFPPDRDALVRALEHRYLAASMPGPGLSGSLRRESAGWATAAAVRGALLDRVRVSTALPSDPLWPRKLLRARREEVVSPIEGALILRSYLDQVDMQATWALVRPAPAGPANGASTAGFTEALVRVTFDGEVQWIDPACTMCAPFEVRPSMMGASAMGPGVDEGPPVQSGALEVWQDDRRVRWVAGGPAALEVRQALAELPVDARSDWLAARLVGAGGTLRTAQRIGNAGASIQLMALPGPLGASAGRDPLSPPPLRPDGTAWWAWSGDRVLHRAGELDGAVVVTTDAFTYQRGVDDDGLVEERLSVHERRWTDRELAQLAAARLPVVPPEEVDALDATELEEAPDIAVQAEPPPAPLGE